MDKLLIEKETLENNINELVSKFIIDNPQFDMSINIDINTTYVESHVSKKRKLTGINTKTSVTLTI
jgi:hypothetical protein